MHLLEVGVLVVASAAITAHATWKDNQASTAILQASKSA
jgi:hypothetical protein